MFQSKKCKKNRGGDRLAEWRESKRIREEECRDELQPGANASNIIEPPGIELASCSASSHLTGTLETEPPNVTPSDVAITSTPRTSGKRAVIGEESNTMTQISTESESDTDELLVEEDTPKTNEFKICGRRIVGMDYFFSKIKELNNHSPVTGCTISDMDIIGEVRRGLNSVIKFKCRMCNVIRRVYTDDPDINNIDINTASVAGAMTVGIGHAQLEELISALDAPAMSAHTYNKYHEKVSSGWEETALQDMKDAVAEEVHLALERGDVDDQGQPVLTVVCDGCWSKRSYRKNYNALSGAAAIVGYYTQKVLFMAVRNKFCTVCNRAANSQTSPGEHKCYKNWTGSSTGMEASIIVEGFCRSEEMYGVRYGRMIADGDSSVYAKILEKRPYIDLTVQKIECRNHLLRNYCEKMRSIAVDASLKNTFLRQTLQGKILKLRRAVTSAIKHHKELEDESLNDKITAIRHDIRSSLFHVFGDHDNCAACFCTGAKEGEVNRIPAMCRSGILDKMVLVNRRLVDNAESLLSDVDNNPAEHFNSQVTKKVGNKRINFSQKGAYTSRSYVSVVAQNTTTPLYRLHKVMYGRSPGTHTKMMEMRRKRGTMLESTRNYRRRRIFHQKLSVAPDKDYGPNSQQPDMSSDQLATNSELFLPDLSRTVEERRQLEVDTRVQSESAKWKEERRKLLSASNFGKVINQRPTTGCRSLVTSMLYAEVHSVAIEYGKLHEKDALQELQHECAVTVEPCGLFVHPDIPFLGATPDGLIGTDGLVEVKCPYSAREMTPEEAIAQKKITFWNFDKKKSVITGVNRKHNYFYQVQGQLIITKRQYCLFAVWTPLGLKVERVEVDQALWINTMLPKLEKFYLNCVLPELVDPRKRRSMEIREPLYVLEAKEKQNVEKTKKPKPSTSPEPQPSTSTMKSVSLATM